MALDFQQVQQQVKELGENAAHREKQRRQERQKALALLESYAEDIEKMRHKVQNVARHYDQNLRCALPVRENINACFEKTLLPQQATLLAADGSQIMPDRHAEVSYCLVNVGAIQMKLGEVEAPEILIKSRLIYDDQLYTETGTLGENEISLARDVAERSLLAELAAGLPGPVITLTDGPVELWGVKDAKDASDYQENLDIYLKALEKLCEMGAVTAGYVDKPGANMVIRLLEVMLTPENELPQIKKIHPLRGVSDLDLFRELLEPGDRSAVFAIQSKSAVHYRESLALHFFYLNVGTAGHPWLARVEIPGWVVEDSDKLNNLHAALVYQSSIMGRRPYPYLLHRAHEAAVVSLPEKEQITQMILLELRRRGVQVGETSYKQSAKNLTGRMRYAG
jgi:hypothetical protein